MNILQLEIRTGVHIIIDYFAATFPFICYEEDDEYKIIDDILMIIIEFLGLTKEEIVKQDFVQNRFNYQYKLGQFIILRLIGPELKSGHKSCSIEFKGDGCREFEALSPKKTWIDFLVFFVIKLNASPSRIDLAIDDYEGKYITMDNIKRKLDGKQFTSSFKDKDYTIHGSDKKGFSIQFGSRTSTQMLVIYEKLKEQITKGIDCFQTYWLRFEMRYYKEKAHNVCMCLIDNGMEGFRNYVFGLLYQMIDLKEETNYGDENLHKAGTYLSWKQFLEEAEKAKIEKYKIRVNGFETYKNWVSPLASFYLLNLILHQSKDIKSALLTMLRETIITITNIDKRKIKKINSYLIEKSLTKISLKDLLVIKEKVLNYINVEELPF